MAQWAAASHQRGVPLVVVELAMLFGERLRALRTERGLSQEALADLSGIRQTNISRIERSPATRPSMATATKLARGLGIPVEELTGEVAPSSLSEEEWGDFRARLERLPQSEQRTLLGLVRRLSALPPEQAAPAEERPPQGNVEP